MAQICVGISYKDASVDVRERSLLTAAQQDALLVAVMADQMPGNSELVILSTCNRTELYAMTSDAEAVDCLVDAWAMQVGITNANLHQLVWTLRDADCIRHLFEVSAGLESQVIGEPQILGQVADAYERARTHGAAGTYLSALFQRAIQVGKRVRAETALGHGMVSMSSVAASHSGHIFGDLAKATVLVIGTGEMARSAIAALVRHSVDKLLVANHNIAHAHELAVEWGGEVIPFTQLGEALLRADLVIAAVAAPHAILHTVDIAAMQPARGARPLVIFDIALPRNVEPGVGEIAGVRLYNLDDLQAVTDAHYEIRQAAIPDAALIIAEELKAFQDWQAARAAVPTIQNLRGKAEAIRAHELETVLHRLPDLDAHSRELIADFSRRLVNKLLHQPTLRLKEKTTSDDADLYTSIVADLFALDEGDPR